MDNKRLFSILLVVFIDLLGFSLILPLLPYYAETFNASQFTTGLLIAVYALMQLIGAPILGRLSDRYGRRPVLLVSVFGTFIGFLLFGFATTLWMLFAARDPLFRHGRHAVCTLQRRREAAHSRGRASAR
jgi:DHA1 family tetracycline resistance protein-like MFS transporter